MIRRTFLAATTAGAAALSTSCRPAIERQTSAASPPPSFELDELTLSDLADGLHNGRWSSAKLTELYTSRIKSLDREGPRLGAVIEINPDAAAEAAQLDSERKSGRLRGPLHGIPILIKDNIDTRGRMSTSAGSLALEAWHAPEDAFVAARLRAAGAIFLGKANLSEWANWRSNHSISGWSGRGGQARCPYALDRSPSGSSSGSGVAVAANLCAAAIGTETDGSITSPSSLNGLVGIKPTVGLVSRTGIIPISASQDTAGPMARSVRDVALLLNAMAGVDPKDPAQGTSRANSKPDYTQFLDANGLRGARLGIARKFFANDAPLDRFLSECVATLKKAGAEIIDPADLATYGQYDVPEKVVMQFEFKDGVNRYLARLPGGSPVRSLKELIDFNEKNRQREMPFFEQEKLIESESSGPLADPKYLRARADCVRLSRKEGIDALLAQHKLDAIVTLTSGPAWLIDPVGGDNFPSDCTTPAAVAGYPHITVPAGVYRALPVGLSFFGTAWTEPVLLKLAYSWEQQTKARPKPTFASTVSI